MAKKPRPSPTPRRETYEDVFKEATGSKTAPHKAGPAIIRRGYSAKEVALRVADRAALGLERGGKAVLAAGRAALRRARRR